MPRRATGTSAPRSQPRGQGMREKIEKARDPRHALRRLLPYLSPFRGMLIAVCGLIVIYTLLGLIGPYLMGVAIDRFIAVKELAGPGEDLPLDARRLPAEQPLPGRLVVADGRRLPARPQGAAAGPLLPPADPARELLRRQAGGRTDEPPDQRHRRHQPGRLAERHLAPGRASFPMVGILVAMFVLDIWLALASLLVVPIMFGFTEFVARYTRRGFRELQKNLGELNGVMEEAISGQKVVKAFRRNESALDGLPPEQPGGLSAPPSGPTAMPSCSCR